MCLKSSKHAGASIYLVVWSVEQGRGCRGVVFSNNLGSEGSSLTRREKAWHLRQQLAGALATSTSQPTTNPATTPSHPSRSLRYPRHIHNRKHGLISGAIQPPGRCGRRPVRARAAGAIQRHPGALSQVCPATSSSGTHIAPLMALV